MDSAHNPVAAEQVLEGDPVEGEEEALVVQTALGVNPLDLPPEQFQESLERRKANRKSLIDWVREALVEGVDFGRIHFVKKSTCSLGKNCTIDGHFAKPSLFKPGAEKILGMLGITVNWPTLNQYEQVALDGRKIESIVLRCEAITASGEVAAEGMGARSVAQDGGDLNKALKMAKKSGMIDMTLTLGGLSEIFTQDIEDMVRKSPQEQYPDLPSTPQDHPQAAPRFDRDSKLGFGKHEDKTWREVEGGYLDWLIGKGGGDRAVFAEMEQDARKKPNLSELIGRVHTGLNAISGSAASGILDEWLSTWGYKTVENGTQETLEGLLGILRKEFRAENPKETQAETPLGG